MIFHFYAKQRCYLATLFFLVINMLEKRDLMVLRVHDKAIGVHVRGYKLVLVPTQTRFTLTRKARANMSSRI